VVTRYHDGGAGAREAHRHRAPEHAAASNHDGNPISQRKQIILHHHDP
jgi:hypothetical protein